MEGLNWVKQDCSVIRDDAICDNQTLCRGFILQSQQIFYNLSALLKVHEIIIFPSVKSEVILLFLCISYHCSTSSASLFFKDIYFLLLGIHINEPFGFAESLYISPGLHVRLSTARKGHPSELCSLWGSTRSAVKVSVLLREKHKVYRYYSSVF